MKTAILIACGVLYGLVALLMIGAVLLQESKGGGLAALGGTRAESAFGASNPLRRLTAILAVIFFILASFLALSIDPPSSRAGAGKPEPKPTMGGEPTGESEPPKGTSVTVPIEDKTPAKDPEKTPEKAPEEAPEKTPEPAE